MIRNIFTNFSSRLAVATMGFITLLLTTHFLGKETRGVISIIALGVYIIHIVSDLAGGPSLVYLTPRTRLRKLVFAGTIWGIFTAIVLGSILIYMGNIPKEFGKEVLLIGVLISLHSINQNVLLGQQRIKAYNILFFCQGLIQITTMAVCIFLFKEKGAYPYIYSCIVGYGACYVAGLFLIRKDAPAPSLTETRPIIFVLFANGFFTQGASLCLALSKTKVFDSMGKHLVNSEGAVGIFSTAFSLGEAITIFSMSVSAVVLAKVANQSDHHEARKSVLLLSKLSLALTILAVGGFLLLPAEFYSWLLGKDFLPVKEVFFSIAPGIVFISFGTVFSHYFSGAGKHYLNFISGIFALGITFFTADFFVREMGIQGAGFAYSLSYLLLTIIIFTAFILIGTDRKSDLKELLPRGDDFRALMKLTKNIKE